MNVYDSAHETARALKDSEEYKEFEKARAAAYANDTNKALIEEYKKLQYSVQLAYAAGGTPDDDAMERLKRIAGVLQFSPEAAAFLLAEMRLQKLLSDVFKIVGEAAGIDLSSIGA